MNSRLSRIKNYILNTTIYIPNKREFLVIALLLGFVTYLELDLIQPWDTYEYKSDYKSLFLAGYGVIEFVVFMIVFATPILWNRRDREDNIGKVWKLVVLFIFKVIITATLLYSYNAIYFNHDYNLIKNLPFWIKGVLILGFFPFVMLAIWLRHKSGSSNLTNSDVDTLDKGASIVVKSSQRGEDIKINISDILYIKSDRNYLEINYIEDRVEKMILYRGSLSAMVNELPKDQFCRVHNSYLVRLAIISDPYTVNSTYFIRLSSPKEGVIPVSRTYLKTVREELLKRDL